MKKLHSKLLIFFKITHYIKAYAIIILKIGGKQMTEFEKAQKNLKNDMLVLFILDLIIFFFTLINKVNFFSLVYAVILFIGYNKAKKGNKNAGIIGIIIGILMMLTILSADILDFLLGLFILIHSIKYIEIIDKKSLK